MKKIIIVLTTIAAVGLMVGFSSITVNASGFDLQAHYEKMRAKREQQEKEMTEKWLDDLEADGNLTEEAIKAAGKYGEGRVPNHKSTSGSGTGTYAGGYSGAYLELYVFRYGAVPLRLRPAVLTGAAETNRLMIFLRRWKL